MSQQNLNEFLANINTDAAYEELDEQAMENVKGGVFYSDSFNYLYYPNGYNLNLASSISGSGNVGNVDPLLTSSFFLKVY